MKIFAAILSIYLLALNFAQCKDTKEQEIAENEVECTFSASENQHQNAIDFCSPFCQCHCCHVHTIKSEISFEIQVPQPNRQIFSVLEKQTGNFRNIFLQPPRISVS